MCRRDADDADDALALFALERTELGLGHKRLQGVDTPSQRRYVHQVGALLRSQGAYYAPDALTAGADTPASAQHAISSLSTGGGVQGGVSPMAVPSVTSPPTVDISSPRATAATAESTPDAGVAARPVLVQLPQRPVLHLRELELLRWFARPPAGPLVCAVHTEMPQRPGPCFVTHWSEPLSVARDALAGELVFRLDGVPVCGDVRVSVFTLPQLLEARRNRAKHGDDPRLPFDRAEYGPYGSGGADSGWAAAREGGGRPAAMLTASELQQRRDARWVIAGQEVGCLFYFIFHTGFCGAQQELHVPLHMMDRAFKNRNGQYRVDGESTLRFAAATPDLPPPATPSAQTV